MLIKVIMAPVKIAIRKYPLAALKGCLGCGTVLVAIFLILFLNAIFNSFWEYSGSAVERASYVCGRPWEWQARRAIKEAAATSIVIHRHVEYIPGGLSHVTVAGQEKWASAELVNIASFRWTLHNNASGRERYSAEVALAARVSKLNERGDYLPPVDLIDTREYKLYKNDDGEWTADLLYTLEPIF